MKVRNGFVSNSSSSSFVIFKEILSYKKLYKILNLKENIKKLIEKDEKNGGLENLKDKFSYYDSDPWRIVEYDDFIFGETSMDNFSIYDYLEYIKVDMSFVKWDDGYNDEPYNIQLDFIKEMKKEYRKKKLIKINNKKQ